MSSEPITMYQHEDDYHVHPPGKTIDMKKKLLSKRPNIKDDIEPYKRACEMLDTKMKKDWQKYGEMLAEREVRMGLQELENSSITAQQYRSDIVPSEMRQNQGTPYQDLVDYEMLSESIVNENEVQFVFRLTYSHQGKLFVEDETIWVTRETVEHTQEEIYSQEVFRDYEWKIAFHGEYANGLVSCLQLGWLKRLISACAVVPSYNDTM